MLILYYQYPGLGWSPINYMVELATELFEADLLQFDRSTAPGLATKLGALALGRRRSGDETCLVVCAGPPQLSTLLLARGWRRRFRRVVAWVIDSFWLNYIPRVIKYSRPFDHVFVTSEEDIPEWERAMGSPVSWLPWGTDALRQGCGRGREDRPWDLVRIGRQPPEWDDDRVSEGACREAGIRFHGRPQAPDEVEDNQRFLMEFRGRSKFTLAFSNLVNPAGNTHPTRDYLTGRWVDALACGTIVAGVSPRAPSVQRLLWPGAILELGSTRREEGIPILREAVRSWRPAQAEFNYQKALERLDWRWRFQSIAEALGESPRRLNEECRLLRQAAETEVDGARQPLGMAFSADGPTAPRAEGATGL